jgi:hypothetical protein
MLISYNKDNLKNISSFFKANEETMFLFLATPIHLVNKSNIRPYIVIHVGAGEGVDTVHTNRHLKHSSSIFISQRRDKIFDIKHREYTTFAANNDSTEFVIDNFLIGIETIINYVASLKCIYTPTSKSVLSSNELIQHFINRLQQKPTAIFLNLFSPNTFTYTPRMIYIFYTNIQETESFHIVSNITQLGDELFCEHSLEILKLNGTLHCNYNHNKSITISHIVYYRSETPKDMTQILSKLFQRDRVIIFDDEITGVEGTLLQSSYKTLKQQEEIVSNTPSIPSPPPLKKENTGVPGSGGGAPVVESSVSSKTLEQIGNTIDVGFVAPTDSGAAQKRKERLENLIKKNAANSGTSNPVAKEEIIVPSPLSIDSIDSIVVGNYCLIEVMDNPANPDIPVTVIIGKVTNTTKKTTFLLIKQGNYTIVFDNVLIHHVKRSKFNSSYIFTVPEEPSDTKFMVDNTPGCTNIKKYIKSIMETLKDVFVSKTLLSDIDTLLSIDNGTTTLSEANDALERARDTSVTSSVDVKGEGGGGAVQNATVANTANRAQQTTLAAVATVAAANTQPTINKSNMTSVRKQSNAQSIVSQNQVLPVTSKKSAIPPQKGKNETTTQRINAEIKDRSIQGQVFEISNSNSPGNVLLFADPDLTAVSIKVAKPAQTDTEKSIKSLNKQVIQLREEIAILKSEKASSDVIDEKETSLNNVRQQLSVLRIKKANEDPKIQKTRKNYDKTVLVASAVLRDQLKSHAKNITGARDAYNTEKNAQNLKDSNPPLSQQIQKPPGLRSKLKYRIFGTTGGKTNKKQKTRKNRTSKRRSSH